MRQSIGLEGLSKGGCGEGGRRLTEGPNLPTFIGKHLVLLCTVAWFQSKPSFTELHGGYNGSLEKALLAETFVLNLTTMASAAKGSRNLQLQGKWSIDCGLQISEVREKKF